MIITIAKQRISDFQHQVNTYATDVRKAGQSAWDNIDLSRKEPEVVYEFLSGKGVGTDYLNNHLSEKLSLGGRVVKFASVFLHQKPMVRGWRRTYEGSTPTQNPLTKRCELGDLQIIFLYLAQDKTVCQCRSIIFQAKKRPATGGYVIEDEFQRPLYDECSGFNYETVLPNRQRWFPTGAARERALQYLFVGEQPVQARTIPADFGQGAFISFGELYLRFLNDSTGHDVYRKRKNDDSWNQVTWDMIEYVAEQSTRSGQMRNSGLQGLLAHFNSFEHRENYFLDVGSEAPEHGTGVQLVIVWDPDLGGSESRGQESLRGFPFTLLGLAEDYRHIRESEAKRRGELKDEAAEEMGRFILESGISHCQIANVANQFRDEGLVVGLATAIAMKPAYSDIGPLLAVAHLGHLMHVRERLVIAVGSILRAKDIRGPERVHVEERLVSYLKEAKGPLSAALSKLWHDSK